MSEGSFSSVCRIRSLSDEGTPAAGSSSSSTLGLSPSAIAISTSRCLP
jgi:hypothetical protein